MLMWVMRALLLAVVRSVAAVVAARAIAHLRGLGRADTEKPPSVTWLY